MRWEDIPTDRNRFGGAGKPGNRARLLSDCATFRQAPAATPPDPAAEAQARTDGLLRAIEGEIVPRLVMARRAANGSERPAPADGGDIGQADRDELVRLLLAHEADVASAFLDTVFNRGASFEAVCLSLLAPAARQLGLMWESDACDFMQVTVGLCRLHQLLRELSVLFRADVAERPGERNILLAQAPGDQHTFGIAVVAQFLLQAGWQVWSELSGEADKILGAVRGQWFAAVGLSISAEVQLDGLVRVIGAIRRESRNRSVGIMVGGALLALRPELATAVGADATAEDGRVAVQRAELLRKGIRPGV